MSAARAASNASAAADALDDIFAALSDPIRRGIVTRLANGPCSVTQLGAPFGVSAPAISKHLAVLERCGLITRWKVGRVHYCRLVADSLSEAGAWIAHHRNFWEARFDALGEYLDRGGADMRAAPANFGIRLERRFRAPPERVFGAFTRPSALREWWCPPGWEPAEIEVDLRVGGAYRIAMAPIGGGGLVSVVGRFLEIRPPERIAYTWRWEGAFADMPETRVILEFQRSGDETVLTLRHENFPDAAFRQQHRTGWIAACNRIDRMVTP
jgi:uncharacterized protein YndB with AHSA1/START domain/DNA-binding transcriptional ArsR family regulator